jgi:hypothetical protein
MYFKVLELCMKKKIFTILRSVFTIRVYFAFSVPCQKCVFDNLDQTSAHELGKQTKTSPSFSTSTILQTSISFFQEHCGMSFFWITTNDYSWLNHYLFLRLKLYLSVF